jgi:iron(III) transport system substrate-binding protein
MKKEMLSLLFLAACAMAGWNLFTPQASFAQLNWQGEWEKSLALAKKEGKVVVAGPPGQQFRVALTAFRKSTPEIQVEYVGIQGQDFSPRIMQERRAGQFLWDVLVGGASSMMIALLPNGVLDPLRPALILPDIMQDKNWRGGFEDGWMDQEKKYIYGFPNYLIYGVQINRDFISDAEFSKGEDLWDPKWKGKIAWHDPRGEGSGANQGLMILLHFGEDALRRLFKEQEIVLTKDYRQQVEWLVRGRYPIGLGVLNTVLWTFKNEGLGKNVNPLKDPRIISATPGFGNVVLINRAPHLNAAKIYINWLLSSEGQISYAKNTGDNSRRLDVPVVNSELAPHPGVQYRNTMRQEYVELRKKVNRIAKEIFQ